MHLAKNSSTSVCSNCKWLGHTCDSCVLTIAKSIEAKKRAHELKKPPSTSSTLKPKILIIIKDASGWVFTVMVDSEVLEDVQPTQPSEFASIVSDPIPTASIEEVKYKGWIVIEEELTTSVDWNRNTVLAPEDTLMVTPSTKFNGRQSHWMTTLFISTQVPWFTSPKIKMISSHSTLSCLVP